MSINSRKGKDIHTMGRNPQYKEQSNDTTANPESPADITPTGRNCTQQSIYPIIPFICCSNTDKNLR